MPGVWLGGAVFAAVINALESRGPPPLYPGETDYVLAHPGIAFSLASSFVLFAGLYFLVEKVFGVRIRRGLAWTHFGLMLLGSALVLAPPLLIPLSADRMHDRDAIRAFAAWNLVSTLGYLTILISLGVFAWALLDATRQPGGEQ